MGLGDHFRRLRQTAAAVYQDRTNERRIDRGWGPPAVYDRVTSISAKGWPAPIIINLRDGSSIGWQPRPQMLRFMSRAPRQSRPTARCLDPDYIERVQGNRGEAERMRAEAAAAAVPPAAQVRESVEKVLRHFAETLEQAVVTGYTGQLAANLYQFGRQIDKREGVRLIPSEGTDVNLGDLGPRGFDGNDVG